MSLRICPITHKAAKAFVKEHHRHLKPPAGAIFVLSARDGDELVGVALVGRPVARALDDGLTLEVNRVAATGARNACSILYGAAARVGKAMGYTRIFTYTLPEEGGASLRASGWTVDGTTAGGDWDTPSRRRGASERPDKKTRWVRNLEAKDAAVRAALEGASHGE